MDTRTAIVYSRDVACTLIGLGGVLHQEFVGPVSIPLLIFYAAVLQVPGVAHLLALRFGTGSSPSSAGAAPSELPSAPSSTAS